MEKIVDFGISECSTQERLDPAHDKLDLVNGTGEYLGMIRLDDKEIIITRTISSGRGQYNGRIMANEIDYDTYSDGGIAIYYNSDKTDIIIRLEETLNHPNVLKLLNEGKSVIDALALNHVWVDTPLVEKTIISSFAPSEKYIFPEDYDFDAAERLGSRYEKDKDIKKIPIEKVLATGIPCELFERLKSLKKQSSMSMYQMRAFIEELTEQKTR